MFWSKYTDIFVEDPWMPEIINGNKTVIARLNMNVYNSIEPGAYLRFHNRDYSLMCKAKVVKVMRYSSLRDYFKMEGLLRMLPGITTVEEATAIYRKYFTFLEEGRHGICAMHIKITSKLKRSISA